MNVKWNRQKLEQLYHKCTLAEIGSQYGVTRERIRQIFDSLHIQRRRVGRRKYASLRHYLAHNDDSTTMHSYLPIGVVCGECGSSQKLHIHHIVYPATALSDVQILCASCHRYKHNGKTFADRLNIYNRYTKGETQTALAKEYHVTQASISHLIKKMNRPPT